MQQHAAQHGNESQSLTEAGGGAACRRHAMFAGEGVTDEAAAIERVGGKQVQQAETQLHPDQAAQQACGGNEGQIEERDTAADAQNGRGSGKPCAPIGQRTGKRQNKLPGAVIGFFLAFRIGVGEQSADGQQEDGAQAQTQSRGNHETGGLAHGDGGYEEDEESQSARPALGAAHGKKHQHQERKEDVEADLDTHPAAKRNGPSAHSSIVEGKRQPIALSY